MELAFSDVAVFVLPALLVACGLFFGMQRRRKSTRHGKPPTCLDAVEPGGLRLEPDAYCAYALTFLPPGDEYAFPVIVGNRFLGFFGREDALRCDGRDLAATYVGTVMTAAAYCGFVPADATLERARRQLRSSPYAMLPVLDKNQTLLGFITEESIRRVAARTFERV